MLGQSIYPLLTEYICIVLIFWKDFDLDIVSVFNRIKGYSYDTDVVCVFS